MKFQQIHLRVDAEMYEQIKLLSGKSDKTVSEMARLLLKKGIATEYVAESDDMIAKIVRQQIDLAMKTHTERLAKLTSKAGHMSATSAFLNVQALMDLVPKEKRKDVKDMYDNARKKAVEYMRTKTTDWENDF